MEESAIKDLNLEFEEKVKKKNKRTTIYFFARLGIVFLTFLLIAIYLLSPLSSAENMSLSGQIYLTENDIYQALNISNAEKTSLFSLSKEKVEQLLNSHPLIKKSSVELSPFSFNIDIEEIAPSAKYKDVIYSSTGDIVPEEIVKNDNFSDYFSLSEKNMATFINEPIVHDNFSTYLLMICKINKEKHCIEYLQAEENKKSFILYYKQDGNLPYFRVNLTYDDKINLDLYVNNLILSEKLIAAFNRKINESDLSLETIEHEGDVISYYSFDIKITDKKLTIANGRGILDGKE